ncbi:MAG: metallophosphoesterase family protein [Balneolaceae bacterium]
MNKIALISDVHGNLPALKAVISTLEKENPDLWICLGDIVGYGPKPSECIELIRERNMICVLGNHDSGVTGKLSLKHFRNPNRRLIELSKSLITKEQISWLSDLPLSVEGGNGNWLAVHASPENPARWEYLESAFKMRPMLSKLRQDVCFIGHTHRSALVSETIGLKEFKRDHKYFINPGSVGQPRDGDQRASCAIVDLENYIYKNIRVEFEVGKVLMDLEKLGFSRRDAEHLLRVS